MPQERSRRPGELNGVLAFASLGEFLNAEPCISDPLLVLWVFRRIVPVPDCGGLCQGFSDSLG